MTYLKGKIGFQSLYEVKLLNGSYRNNHGITVRRTVFYLLLFTVFI